MPRGIDHLVLCVKNLKTARAQFEALGFTMTPQAQHPFGTGNTLAQFDGSFLEILSVTQPNDIPADEPGSFNFASFNQSYLDHGEGLSMLVLDSTDEEADRRDFVQQGLNVYAPFSFQRTAVQPNGDEVIVGFSLTFVDDAKSLPGMGFFTCRQWKPEFFWKPAYQRHDNGGMQIAELSVVADRGAEPVRFLSAFAAASTFQVSETETLISTSRGDIRVLATRDLEARYPGFSASPSDTPYFAGFTVSVPDIEAVKKIWGSGGIQFDSAANRSWINPDQGLGCILEMRQD